MKNSRICNIYGTGLFFGEAAHSADVVPEVSSFHEVHDEVEVLSVLEGVDHVDDERTPEVVEQLSLIHDGADALLADDLGLVHLLHGEELLVLLELYDPHLPEPSLPDDVLDAEVFLRDHWYTALDYLLHWCRRYQLVSRRLFL